jgi:hypothetical protein
VHEVQDEPEVCRDNVTVGQPTEVTLACGRATLVRLAIAVCILLWKRGLNAP